MGITTPLMTHKHLITSLAITLFLFTLNQSCKKPKDPPQDPCANKVMVTALQQDYYHWAHFEKSGPNGTAVWLYAVNWNDWSSKVVPGKSYRIAYKEVKCPDDHMSNKTMNCFAYPLTCIKVTCLEPVNYTTEPSSSCLGSEINPPAFGDYFTHALKGQKINGNQLRLRMGYSGCDRSQMKKFRLALQEVRYRCPEPKMDRVFMAKVVTDDNTVCQAYFEEDVCFDLTPLRTYMLNEQSYDFSKPIVIRLLYRDGKEEDFVYSF